MKHAFQRLLSALLLAALLVPASAQPARAQGPRVDATGLEQRYRAGVQAFQSGRPYQALELLGGVARIDPAYQDVQLLLGQACLVTGLLVPAKRHFETALEQRPGNGLAAYLLGFTLHQSSRWVEAVEALTRAHAMAPGNPNPLVYRGLSHLRLGRAQEARRDIEEALGLAPRDPVARRALAELELAAGDHARARKLAEDVLAGEPGDADTRVLLARILLESGEPAAALPHLERVLERTPARTDALYLEAQAQLRSGDREAGRATLERFQELKAREERLRVLQVEVKTDPEDLASRKELVRTLLERGQAGDALMHLAVLQEQAPRDPEVRQLARRVEAARGGGGSR